ncbi:MAG: metallophosphoesterase [Planctomycetales bacterium]|nr:metallophosphoesterase [Planctomycetales bacterium]
MSPSRERLRAQATLRSATQANLSDKCRRGYEVVLPDEGDLVVIGDLHGHMENLRAAIAFAALDEHPDRHVVYQEVIHQLTIGEDKSYQVLEEVAAQKARYPDRVHVILGNHDLAEWQGREIFKGGVVLNLVFRRGILNAYGDEEGALMHAAYKEFIATMPIAVRACGGTVLVVHTTPEKRHLSEMSAELLRKPPDAKDWAKGGWVEHLVWGRDFTPETADEFAKRMEAEHFVVGHTPQKDGSSAPNHRHVIIDCKDAKAAFIRIELARRYTHDELVACVRKLSPGKAPKRPSTRGPKAGGAAGGTPVAGGCG